MKWINWLYIPISLRITGTDAYIGGGPQIKYL